MRTENNVVLIEVSEELADELLTELRATGAGVSVHKEERYFGDAHTVTFVLDIAKSTLGIIASTLTIWRARTKSELKVNGNPLPPTETATEDDEKAVTETLTR